MWLFGRQGKGRQIAVSVLAREEAGRHVVVVVMVVVEVAMKNDWSRNAKGRILSRHRGTSTLEDALIVKMALALRPYRRLWSQTGNPWVGSPGQKHPSITIGSNLGWTWQTTGFDDVRLIPDAQ